MDRDELHVLYSNTDHPCRIVRGTQGALYIQDRRERTPGEVDHKSHDWEYKMADGRGAGLVGIEL